MKRNWQRVKLLHWANLLRSSNLDSHISVSDYQKVEIVGNAMLLTQIKLVNVYLIKSKA